MCSMRISKAGKHLCSTRPIVEYIEVGGTSQVLDKMIAKD